MDQIHQLEKRTGRLLWRGFTKACPLCGNRKLFRRWIHMIDRCPKCGLRFERIEGHWIGAVGMNTIFAFVVLFFGLATFFLITYPDVPVGSWIFVFAGAYGFVPLIFYPNSKTLWTAIDILMRPIVEEDFSDEVIPE